MSTSFLSALVSYEIVQFLLDLPGSGQRAHPGWNLKPSVSDSTAGPNGATINFGTLFQGVLILFVQELMSSLGREQQPQGIIVRA